MHPKQFNVELVRARARAIVDVNEVCTVILKASSPYARSVSSDCLYAFLCMISCSHDDDDDDSSNLFVVVQ